MAITEAQKRAVAKYNAANYDRIEIKVPKGRKYDIQIVADSQGESINGLVNKLLREETGMTEAEWKAPAED